MPRVEPLTPKVRLAPNPTGSPRFAVRTKRRSGDFLEVADPRATRAMVALMDMDAQLGGAASHWGGPSAFAELMSALHGLMFAEAQTAKKPWYELFHFVNDAGHCENGLYALKANYGWAGVSVGELRKFRSISSRLTGHGEAHLFPEGVWVSNGPLGSGLPQAQGLAVADALAGRKRLTVCAISDGGCMEGEAREALAAIPGLAAKGKMAPFVMIISDNNTKLSGRIDADSFSMAPTFAALASLGWHVLDLFDGHDLEACTHTLEMALDLAEKNPLIPVAIHARTIKGYGVEKTAASASGGHGFPLKSPGELKGFLSEIYAGQPLPKELEVWRADLEAHGQPAAAQPGEKVQAGVARALIRARESGLPVVSVTSDLPGSTGVAEFHKKFPEAGLDVGVAEANMVSTAIGLAKAGFIPIVDTFSQFGVSKGKLPLIMSALSQGPVIAIFSHAGFQDAADGASHQALTYFAATCGIPHTDVYALTSSEEAEALVGQALSRYADDVRAGRTPRSQIFFLGRENFPKRYLPEGATYQLGQAQVVRDELAPGKSGVTIVATGALLGEALQAAELLAAKGMGSIVVNPSTINHPDVRTLAACLERTQGRLVTVEDHQVVGGMGAIMVHSLAQAGVALRVRSLGVRDEFGQSAYSAAELYQKHEMSAASIAQAAQSLIG